MIVPLSALASLRPQVCVVGAGPVGLALAARLFDAGVRVVVLESGGRRPEAGRQGLSEAERLDPVHHAPMSLAVCRALGGTSWLWGGRCVPLDPIDFEARPGSGGWPIGPADIAPYYAPAAAFLGCGEAEFVRPLAADGVMPKADAWAGLRLDRLERWCDEPRLRPARLPAGLPICLNAIIVGLSLRPGSARVAALRAISGGMEVEVRAARFVFACGGLETARLLLNVEAEHPGLFGGPDGPLGRNYMGHLSGRIANIVFSPPGLARAFAYRSEAGSGVRRRIMIDEAVQRRDALPNIAFYPDNPRLSDPGHGSGILSFIFLLLSAPIIGRRLISEGIRQMQMSERPRFAAHLRNVLLDAPRTAALAADLCWQRFAIGRRKPFVFLASRNGEYPLHYHGEHAPGPDSRVVLGRGRDASGLRRLQIDLQFRDADAEGVVRAHAALDRGLRAAGLGELRFHDAPPERARSVLAQARDGFHQIGLARMGRTPADGVVDADCRAFGLDNLFLAGSAVFPSSGQANPTLAATALGLRLADHLIAKARSVGAAR